jgi:hypothetical protein
VTKRETILAYWITAERDLHLYPKSKIITAIKYAASFAGATISTEVLTLLWSFYSAHDIARAYESAWVVGGLVGATVMVTLGYLLLEKGVRTTYETR